MMGKVETTIRAYIEGEPRLVERHDGWYVETIVGDYISSAGPTSKELAELILKKIRDEIRTVT